MRVARKQSAASKHHTARPNHRARRLARFIAESTGDSLLRSVLLRKVSVMLRA